MTTNNRNRGTPLDLDWVAGERRVEALPKRIGEIEQAIEAGAREVDVVIPRNFVLTGDWKALYNEIAQFRQTCGDAAHLKTILATGELGTLKQVYHASLVAMMAGSDFI